MRFLTYLKCNLRTYYSSGLILYAALKYALPSFGILITYYTYLYNDFQYFNNVFPKLILWIVFTRSFLIGSSKIIGKTNFQINTEMKILGFNKYHLIASNFITVTFYESLPTALFYFVVFTYAFKLPYSTNEMLGFIGLIIFASVVLYVFAVLTKINQGDDKPSVLLPTIIFMLILFTSSPVVNNSVIDPDNVWFHWVAIINPLAALNLLSQAIFHHLQTFAQLYLPLSSLIFWTIFSPFFWRYLVWLRW